MCGIFSPPPPDANISTCLDKKSFSLYHAQIGFLFIIIFRNTTDLVWFALKLFRETSRNIRWKMKSKSISRLFGLCIEWSMVPCRLRYAQQLCGFVGSHGLTAWVELIDDGCLAYLHTPNWVRGWRGQALKLFIMSFWKYSRILVCCFSWDCAVSINHGIISGILLRLRSSRLSTR